MRVLYSFPHPVGGFGGVGTVAWHHVDALARAGAAVTLVCPTVRHPFDPELGIRTISVLGPVRPRMIGRARAYDLVDRVAAAQVRRGRPDVAHVWPGALLRTAQAARKHDTPTVREAPSPYTRVAVEQARAAWAELGLPVPDGHFHHIPERTLVAEDSEFQTVDQILVGSPEAAATFSNTPFAARVSVNRYGYDPGLFQAKDTRTHGGGQPQKLVFVARCEPTKGIHVLLRAWARCARPRGSRLVLRGEMRAEIRQALAAELAVPGLVEVGPVPDMAAFLADADAMVLPSFSEGSALITYESLGCGVIPLISRATGAPVSSGVDGLIHDTGDVGQLVEHLDATLNDPGLRQRLRRAGTVTARQLTWASVGQRLMALYSGLVDRTSERGATP